MKVKIFSLKDEGQRFSGMETAIAGFVDANPGISVAGIDTHKDGVMLVAVVKYTGTLTPPPAPVEEAPAAIIRTAPEVAPEIGNVKEG